MAAETKGGGECSDIVLEGECQKDPHCEFDEVCISKVAQKRNWLGFPSDTVLTERKEKKAVAKERLPVAEMRFCNAHVNVRQCQQQPNHCLWKDDACVGRQAWAQQPLILRTPEWAALVRRAKELRTQVENNVRIKHIVTSINTWTNVLDWISSTQGTAEFVLEQINVGGILNTGNLLKLLREINLFLKSLILIIEDEFYLPVVTDLLRNRDPRLLQAQERVIQLLRARVVDFFSNLIPGTVIATLSRLLSLGGKRDFTIPEMVRRYIYPALGLDI